MYVMLNENSCIIHGDQIMHSTDKMAHFQSYDILLLESSDFFLCTVWSKHCTNSQLVIPHEEEGAAP